MALGVTGIIDDIVRSADKKWKNEKNYKEWKPRKTLKSYLLNNWVFLRELYPVIIPKTVSVTKDLGVPKYFRIYFVL